MPDDEPRGVCYNCASTPEKDVTQYPVRDLTWCGGRSGTGTVYVEGWRCPRCVRAIGAIPPLANK